MKLAVTHAGAAHADEFIALAILAASDRIDRIERRDPTEQELNNPTVWVIDVGGRYQPASKNLDHHGVEGTEGKCAFDLVLEHVGLRGVAAAASPWLAFKSHLDCYGPYRTASEFGMSPESLYATISPIESQALQAFAAVEEIQKGDFLWYLLRMVGLGLIEYWQAFDRDWRAVKEGATTFKVGGLVFCDFRTCGDVMPAVTSQYLESAGAAGSVSVDNRGPGAENRVVLYRHADHPRVDFTRLDSEEMHFVHHNGFLAKTKDGQNSTERVTELLEKAVQ